MVTTVASRVRSQLRRRAVSVPTSGWEPGGAVAPALDALDDASLEELNELLPWACFTVDRRGRRFGDAAWAGKRDTPQILPDPRIVRMDEIFGLADKRVLEVGCFEGVHTIALCQRSRSVIAVDSRVTNVVKTTTRCAFYGVHPDIGVVDLDTAHDLDRFACDVVHHVGVLYHLQEPVRHLVALGAVARTGIYLDTHVARPSEADEEHDVDGFQYRFRRFAEGRDPFSGMHAFARWLPLDDLRAVLVHAGYPDIDVLEERDERNGLRVLLAARR